MGLPSRIPAVHQITLSLPSLARMGGEKMGWSKTHRLTQRQFKKAKTAHGSKEKQKIFFFFLCWDPAQESEAARDTFLGFIPGGSMPT